MNIELVDFVHHDSYECQFKGFCEDSSYKRNVERGTYKDCNMLSFQIQILHILLLKKILVCYSL